MSQVQGGSEAAAAALVGSLDVFPLVEVLGLLSQSRHTGELQVVGRGTDRRLWLDDGALVQTDPSVPPDPVLFELACLDEGWFYFTVGAAPSGPRYSVAAVLDALGPQVGEWRELVRALPADAVVRMSSTTPAAEVQIRASQWQLLSLVGSTGRSVRDVVTEAPQHSLDTLRTLRELVSAGLIEVVLDGPVAEEPPEPFRPSEAVREGPSSSMFGASEPAPAEEPAATDGPVSTKAAEERTEHVPAATETSGPVPLVTTSTLPPPPPPEPEMVNERPVEADPWPTVPPAPDGWVEQERSGVEFYTPPGGTPYVGPPSGQINTVPPGSVMPPPISGDPWSVGTTRTTNGDEPA